MIKLTEKTKIVEIKVCGTIFLGLGVYFVVIVWWGAVISLGRNLYFLIERLNCDGILIDVVILKVW